MVGFVSAGAVKPDWIVNLIHKFLRMHSAYVSMKALHTVTGSAGVCSTHTKKLSACILHFLRVVGKKSGTVACCI